MNDDENKTLNTNEPEQPAEAENNSPKKKRWRGSYHGEAFWASLVIMIIEGIFVHFFCFPMDFAVALSIIASSEGWEITAVDKMASAVGCFAFLFPIVLFLINGCVMLSEDNNEREKAMKTVNLIAYILYPVICLGGCAFYFYSFGI